jgi:hypothetical protein
MEHNTKTGAVLFRDDVIFPDSLRIQSEPYQDVWRVIKGLDGYALDRTMREAGWTCFYMVDEIKAGGFGLNREESVRRAVKQILRKLQWERFNSLKITNVTTKHFLGLLHITVSVQALHIQESVFRFDSFTKEPGQQTPVFP